MTLTLDYVKAKSASKLSGLNAVVRSAAEALIEGSYARGVPILITQGLRTIAEQSALYAQGRTTAGSIVTNAKGGYSYHNFGLAIDFALLLENGSSVSWDTARDGDADGVKDWSEVVDVAKALGFAWGGDFKSFKDLPHFEMTFGLTTAQLRAGGTPSEIAMAKAQAVIDKYMEEADELSAEDKKRIDELEAAVKALEKKQKMAAIPAWALPACEAAKAAGYLDTTANGSYDFYRMITVMDRVGLFKKEAK